MTRFRKEETIRTLAVSVASAAAVVAGLLLIRQQRNEPVRKPDTLVPAGESAQSAISLDRIRELGI